MQKQHIINLLSIFLLIFFTSQLQAQHVIEKKKQYRLGAGDKIAVFVWKQPTLSIDVTINPNGSFNYPLIGEIQALGKTTSELQEEITNRFDKHLQIAQITVTLVEAYSYRIYVTGEVIRPGVFQLRSAVTVIQAIAMAGGFSVFASKNDLIIYNPLNKHLSSFNYDDFVSNQSSAQDVFLLPGDTIVVR